MEHSTNKKGASFAFADQAVRMVSAVAIFLLPKCSLCLAAYMNLLGVFGVSLSSFASWIMPVLLALLLVNLLISYLKARQMDHYVAFYILLTGAVLLFAGKILVISQTLSYLGLFLLTAGSAAQLWQARKTCSRSFF